MAAIIDAVQNGIWQAGVHDLLGYATDYAFGQQRGLQTLVLKSKYRSAYVRLHWDTVMGDTVAVFESLWTRASETRLASWARPQELAVAMGNTIVAAAPRQGFDLRL